MSTLLFTRMHYDVLPPVLGTPNSVGADVHAYLKTESGRPSKMMIPVKETRAIPTGLVVRHDPKVEYLQTDIVDEIPSEIEPVLSVMVCSRSGMAKKSIFVTNSPGIIDPDYRGEVIILLYNGSFEPQWISHGDRIAQLLLLPVPVPFLREAESDLRLEKTTRGENGFGSTGR